MKHNKIISLATALLLSFSSLFLIAVPKALAATITWSGGGADTKVSTAANWVGGVAPVDGDALVFPSADSTSVLNDTLTTIGGITMQDYAGANPKGYLTISGDFTLTGNLTIGSKGDISLPNITLGSNSSFLLNDKTTSKINFINSSLSLGSNNLLIQYPNWQTKTNADGSIYISEVQFNNSTLSGASNSTITVNGAQLSFNIASPSLASTITLNTAILKVVNPVDLGTASIVQNNSQLAIADVSSSVTKNFTQAFTFNGNLYGATWKDDFLIGLQSLATVGTFDVTLSGPVVITKDTAIEFSSTLGGRNFTVTGPLSGSGLIGLTSYDPNFTFVVNSSANTSVIPNGNYQVITNPTTLADDLPAKDVIVVGGNKLTLNGKRNSVIVSAGSSLLGSGTAAGAVLVQTSATLAPGQSPGCISSGNLTLAGTLAVEIGGITACTEYDQQKVTGTVNITGATLTTSLYNNFKPAAGQSYTIIDNDAADAVTGTFNNLAEGATFTVGGYVLKVSYVGGTGNDVVLTVQSVPGTPNTGFSLINAHPLQAFMVITVMAGVIALIARKYNRLLAK